MEVTVYHPSKDEFLSLAQQGNIIPVFREVTADTDTPISLFKKVAKGPESFLLESVSEASVISAISAESMA